MSISDVVLLKHREAWNMRIIPLLLMPVSLFKLLCIKKIQLKLNIDPCEQIKMFCHWSGRIGVLWIASLKSHLLKWPGKCWDRWKCVIRLSDNRVLNDSWCPCQRSCCTPTVSMHRWAEPVNLMYFTWLQKGYLGFLSILFFPPLPLTCWFCFDLTMLHMHPEAAPQTCYRRIYDVNFVSVFMV